MADQNSNVPYSKPYMGNLTSSQIGYMAKAGVLGGEMVRRMVASSEQELMQKYDPNQLN